MATIKFSGVYTQPAIRVYEFNTDIDEGKLLEYIAVNHDEQYTSYNDIPENDREYYMQSFVEHGYFEEGDIEPTREENIGDGDGEWEMLDNE